MDITAYDYAADAARESLHLLREPDETEMHMKQFCAYDLAKAFDEGIRYCESLINEQDKRKE